MNLTRCFRRLLGENSHTIRPLLPYSTSKTSTRRGEKFLTQPLEEETFADQNSKQFYPVNIGETYRAPRSTTYEFVGKLDNGRNSTVSVLALSMFRVGRALPGLVVETSHSRLKQATMTPSTPPG
jgi:hypothetical protein